jgi:prepilin-type processing-associated H-X9-DG protein
MDNSFRQGGFSLIGLLAAIVIIVILIAIAVPSLQNAVGPTGSGGGVQENQISTHSDRMNLDSIYKSMIMMEMEFGGHLPAPSLIAGSRDKSQDTTANFYSMLVARAGVPPSILISENEQSFNVNPDEDYNITSYNPSSGTYWDPSFKADLLSESNVSFAHMPLLGDRFDQGWIKGGPSMMPVIGNRGPKDGVGAGDSIFVGVAWAGNVVYADGHIDFTYACAVPTLYGGSDNLFSVESGAHGLDAILSFTSAISEQGFELQFD